jgi:hypothetical protein
MQGSGRGLEPPGLGAGSCQNAARLVLGPASIWFARDGNPAHGELRERDGCQARHEAAREGWERFWRRLSWGVLGLEGIEARAGQLSKCVLPIAFYPPNFDIRLFPVAFSHGGCHFVTCFER